VAWGRPIPNPAEARLERSVLAGVASFRWAALAWLATVLLVSRADLSRPAVAAALVAAALAFTAAATVLLRRSSAWLLRAPLAVAELGLGFVLLAADGWVYDGEHPQSLGSAWPLAGAMSIGIVVGPSGGIVAAMVLGAGRIVATLVDDLPQPSTLSILSTGVLYGLAGAVAGFAMRRLRAAEMEISAARAREEVARTLHDGVLQTLAVVQRRSTDTDLAALARDQERELRDFLFGLPDDHNASGDLTTELRAVAGRCERRHGVRAEVIVVEDPGPLPPATVAAVAGAVGEALTNAAKHGHAQRVVVYAEADDDEVFVSVKDDGGGFDPTVVGEGTGLVRSVRGRIDDVGGRVEVDSQVGRGTEVRLWAPT
jgi:signal transduction histidine kinase